MAKRRINIVNVRELARNTGRVLDDVEEGALVLVTKNGRPVASVAPIPKDALEDFLLANAPDIVEALAEAEREIAAGRTVSLASFVSELKSQTARG